MLVFPPSIYSQGSGADALVTSLSTEPINLIPFFATDSASAQISRLIFNGLVKYDKNLKLVGDLADHWEILDDGKKIIFYLKKDIFWQDGAAFRASDVEFTFKKLTDPNLPTPYGADFKKVKSFQVIDPYTIEILYEEPFVPGLASWGMGIVPKHLLEKENLLTSQFARKPIGTGPFILSDWKTGERLTLVRNEHYFEGAPKIFKIICRIIPDSSTEFLELATEGIDWAGLTPLQFKRETDTKFFKEKYKKFNFLSPTYTYLGYNLKNPIFSEAKVRHAIGLAIKRKNLIDVVLLGQGRQTSGPFLPRSWAYNPKVPDANFDLAQSKKLLEESGWKDSNADGFLDKEGKKFSFTILTNLGNDERKMIAEIIQQDLKKIGIDVKIQILEWSIFLKEHVNKKNFDAVLLGWQLPQDPDIYSIFHSSMLDEGFNFISYKNTQVDKLLEEGQKTFDETSRAKIYHQIHEIINRDEPYTFLYVPDALGVIHKRFQDVEVTDFGLGHNLIHWSVNDADVKYRFKTQKKKSL